MSKISFEDEGKISGNRIIHAPSIFAKKNLIYVQEVGTLKSLKSHVCIRENMQSFLFFIVKKGSGIVKVGGNDYEVRKGDCIFIDCKNRYEHCSSELDPWEISWVHFYGKIVENLYSLFLEANENKPMYCCKKESVYIQCLETLEQNQRKTGILAEIDSNVILNNFLKIILDEVSVGKSLSIDAVNDANEELFEDLREMVNEHCSEHGLLGTLAIQYGTPPEKLNEYFEKKYGITLSEYIVNRRYNTAKEGLHFSVKPIDEVVREAGFSEYAQFVNMLMKEEHVSPEEYRKKWAQWVKV